MPYMGNIFTNITLIKTKNGSYIIYKDSEIIRDPFNNLPRFYAKMKNISNLQ